PRPHRAVRQRRRRDRGGSVDVRRRHAHQRRDRGGDAMSTIPHDTGIHDPGVHDYSLTGPSARLAVERGLAEAPWFQPAIDPATLRQLQVRSNGRAAVDTVLWIGALVGSGYLAWRA